MELERDVHPDLMLDSSAVLRCVGWALVAIGDDLRIYQAGPDVDAMLGAGAATACIGERVSRIFGNELFGAQGIMTQAIRDGECLKDHGTTINLPGFPARLVSITAAPTRGVRGISPDISACIIFQCIDQAPAQQLGVTLFNGMVAQSTVMLRLFHLIRNLQHSDAHAVILGESGTGKSLVARALHTYSPRRNGPFVSIDCQTLPTTIIHDQLLGEQQDGDTETGGGGSHLRAAQGGTLFLDEIGNLPLDLQARLLAMLHNPSLSKDSSRSGARILAATAMDPHVALQAGHILPEFYERLRLLSLTIPPLRQRPEDIPPLCDVLLARISGRTGRRATLSPPARRALLTYEWPDNVRELENALAYAEAISSDDELQPEDLPAVIREQSHLDEQLPPPRPEESPSGGNEADRLLQALRRHRWRRSAAAAELGISRSTLWRKMREFGL